MSKIQTDQKLELVRAIRMQNQFDRQTLRRREGILYHGAMTGKQGELYSLEEAALSPGNDKYGFIMQKNGSADEAELSTGSLLKGMRFRLALAMILFLAFVYCDVKQISFGGRSMEKICEIIREDQITMLTDYFSDRNIMQSLK